VSKPQQENLLAPVTARLAWLKERSQVKEEAQLLLGTVRRESMPRIAEMDVEMTT